MNFVGIVLFLDQNCVRGEQAMPDVSYDSGGIRAGGSRALAAAAAAEAAIGHLLGEQITAADFGEVAGADLTAAGLVSTRDGYVRTGHQVHARHVDLERRAQSTAAAGDGMVVDTTAIAGSIVAGMQ